MAFADNPNGIIPDDSVCMSPKLPEYYNLMFSPGFHMDPGMENIISFNYLSSLAIDSLIGNRWFSEERIINKAAGATCRLAKNLLIDMPIDYFSVVFSHEYFGHGARYRELSVDNIDYGFDAPPPYGDGGGHASASINDPMTHDEIMTILIGGIETQAIINRKLSMRWMANRKIRYRESSLYYWSFRIMYDYIMGATLKTKMVNSQILKRLSLAAVGL